GVQRPALCPCRVLLYTLRAAPTTRGTHYNGENNSMPARPNPLRYSLFVLAALGSLSVHADTLVDNANGYTLNGKGELVQFTSIAFDDKGRIIAVGASKDVAARAPNAKRIDMQGRTLLPGLIDAHGHVFGLGQQLTQLDLFHSTSLDGALKSIGDYA